MLLGGYIEACTDHLDEDDEEPSDALRSSVTLTRFGLGSDFDDWRPVYGGDMLCATQDLEFHNTVIEDMSDMDVFAHVKLIRTKEEYDQLIADLGSFDGTDKEDVIWKTYGDSKVLREGGFCLAVRRPGSDKPEGFYVGRRSVWVRGGEMEEASYHHSVDLVYVVPEARGHHLPKALLHVMRVQYDNDLTTLAENFTRSDLIDRTLIDLDWYGEAVSEGGDRFVDDLHHNIHGAVDKDGLLKFEADAPLPSP